MIKQGLLLLFFFFAGFARVSYTKIYGVQAFVIIAIFYIFYSYMNREEDSLFRDKNEYGSSEYGKFLLWSLPALFIGIYFGKLDSLYFYAYSVIPYFLFINTNDILYNCNKLLILAEISVLIVIGLGWAIYLGMLPYNFLFNEVAEAQYNLGYWGISYLESSRNHDYMYPLVCTAISIYLFKISTSPINKTIQLTIFGVCEVTLLASLARGGMIAAFVYCFLMFWGLERNGRIIFLTSFFLLILVFWEAINNLLVSTFKNIFLSIFGITNENQYGGNFSNNIRKEIYTDAIMATLVNPIGYGIQNFGITSRFGGGSAENAYLTIMVERGWLAAYYFIAFLWNKWKLVINEEQRETTLNFYLIPSIVIYFLFNYEFTSYMCVFVFYLILLSVKKEY